MYNLSDIQTVKRILGKHGFMFSKSLGQNFIIDSKVCPSMAKSCSEAPQEDGVLEIGPGIGVLTTELAKRFKKVVAVEIDKRLIPILAETTNEFENIKIINSDILKVNLKELFENEFKNCRMVHVCANLPYYITSEIIMYILENNPGFKTLTAMLQKEAADRICAAPGTRQTGAITLAVNYYGSAQVLFGVPRHCFIPSPNVDSCVIKIDMQGDNMHKIKNSKIFFNVIKAAYGQRRKNILNALSAGLGRPKEEVQKVLLEVGVHPSFRAEQLSFENFASISNYLAG